MLNLYLNNFEPGKTEWDSFGFKLATGRKFSGKLTGYLNHDGFWCFTHTKIIFFQIFFKLWTWLSMRLLHKSLKDVAKRLITFPVRQFSQILKSRDINLLKFPFVYWFSLFLLFTKIGRKSQSVWLGKSQR